LRKIKRKKKERSSSVQIIIEERKRENELYEQDTESPKALNVSCI
jgi:hypothetical protein